GGCIYFGGLVVKRYAARHAALADAVVSRRMGLRFSALGQRAFDVDSSGQPADPGGFRRDLRALGERPSWGIGSLRCDLDFDLGFRGDHLLSHRPPLRRSTTLVLRAVTLDCR